MDIMPRLRIMPAAGNDWTTSRNEVIVGKNYSLVVAGAQNIPVYQDKTIIPTFGQGLLLLNPTAINPNNFTTSLFTFEYKFDDKAFDPNSSKQIEEGELNKLAQNNGDTASFSYDGASRDQRIYSFLGRVWTRRPNHARTDRSGDLEFVPQAP